MDIFSFCLAKRGLWLLVLHLLPQVAFAAPTVVFGPAKYQAKLVGASYQQNFSVSQISNPYTLTITNGSGANYSFEDCPKPILKRLLCELKNLEIAVRMALERTAKLEIRLNGTTIVSDANFITQAVVSKPVSLLSQNTLKVTAYGLPTASVSVKITGLALPPPPPVAVITASTLTGVAPETISFSGLSSFDPNGGAITNFQWTFSDGGTASGALTQHTFLTAGVFTVTLKVTSSSGLFASSVAHVSIRQNLIPVANFTGVVQTINGFTLDVDASSSQDADGSITNYLWNFGDGQTATGVQVHHTYAGPGQYAVTLTVTDNKGATASLTKNFDVRDIPNLPPDPAGFAPALTPGVMTSLFDATQFLITSGVQTGINPTIIDELKAGAVRGRVVRDDGSPLSGVKVNIVSHPEFGQTLSRADGQFDLVFNTDGGLTLQFERAGYFKVQRPLEVPAQNYGSVGDIIMLQADQKVTSVTLGSPNMQVAQSSLVTDSSGSRTGTLLIPANTSATMVLPNGSTQNINTLNIRITEYSVGDNGKKRMPAELPPRTGYTYAVELSADEALSINAKTVTFSQPLHYYLDNFLNFSVGTPVPVGYYDFDSASWIASPNGRVIKILSVVNQMAVIDIHGFGSPATTAEMTALKFTSDEAKTLATKFSSGQVFWRVPISHFSIFDFNWFMSNISQFLPTTNFNKLPLLDEPHQDACEQANASTINIQDQILSESLPVVGTPFTINYSTDRVPGRTARYSFTMTLQDGNPQPNLKSIDFEFDIAGRRFAQSHLPSANLKQTVNWDGKDVFGRLVQSQVTGHGRVRYHYHSVYPRPPDEVGILFGYPYIPNSSIFVESRDTIDFDQNFDVALGGWNSVGAGLGGWTLSEQHFYDPVAKRLYLGSNEVLTATNLPSLVSRFAGNLSTHGANGGDGGPRLAASFGSIAGLASAPDGTLYIADSDPQNQFGLVSIRKIDPKTGVITKIAGATDISVPVDFSNPDTIRIVLPRDIKSIERGIFYYLSREQQDLFSIYKVNQGITTKIIGGGSDPGESVLATNAAVSNITSIFVDRRGGIYFTDGNRIRYINPQGYVRTVAGSGTLGSFTEGQNALLAPLLAPTHVVVDSNDNMYFSTSDDKIINVTSDGLIHTLVGGGPKSICQIAETELASELQATESVSLDVDANDSLLVNTRSSILRITPSGTVFIAAGKPCVIGASGDNGPALQATLGGAHLLASDASGNVYWADFVPGESGLYDVIRKTGPAMPGFSSLDYVVASSSGDELFIFDKYGRHQQTKSSLTGVTKYKFEYDNRNNLVAIQDVDGNVTTIERDTNGQGLSLTSPYGQETGLTYDQNSYLSSISDPNGNTFSMIYKDSGGLLSQMQKPNGATSIYTYDSQGRLKRDQDGAGGSFDILRTLLVDGFKVQTTTGENRTSSYSIERTPAGGEARINTNAAGLQNSVTYSNSRASILTSPDASTFTNTIVGDPRFGLQSAFDSETKFTTLGGRQFSSLRQKTAALMDASNPLSVSQLTDLVTINGSRNFLNSFDAATKLWTNRSAEGRVVYSRIDDKEKLVQTQVGNLTPTLLNYDPRGRLSEVVQGPRVTAINYNAESFVSSITNSLNQSTLFTYDGAGRVISQKLPDNRVIGFTYDGNGNLTSVNPPGRPEHSLLYNFVDMLTGYTPPGAANLSTLYTYNLDRQLTSLQRPGGLTAGFNYDAVTGRLLSIVTGQGQYQMGYNTAGQVQSTLSPDGEANDYAYDGPLLTSVTSRVGAIPVANVSYLYNNDLQVSAMLINGVQTDYIYDRDGLLTRIGSEFLAYDAMNGLLTGRSLGGFTDTYGYNSFGELANYAVSVSGFGPGVFRYTINRDTLSRVESKTETVSSVVTTYDYSYDSAGRLTGVSKNGALVNSYVYDSNSNRSSATIGGVTQVGTYDDQDRLLSYGANTYTYNANGDLAARTNSLGTTTYTYDVFGSLKKVVLPDGRVIDYLVDAQNRRVAKKINGTVVQRFIYDGPRIVAELNGANQLVSKFFYASKSNSPDYMIKQGGTYQLVTDNLGSIRVILENGGGVTGQMNFDEFGRVTLDSSPGFQPFGFAGGLYDRDTGLTKFGARDYDAEAGRWTSKDPILFNGGDTNLFGYTFSDPVNFIDPSGLSRLDFSRGGGYIDVYPGGEGTYGPPQRFPAGNNTVNPGGDPLTPESFGPAPNGTFPVGPYRPKDGDPNGSYGSGIFPITLPPGPGGVPRTGVGLHSGRENRGGPNAKTQGCIRTTEPALDAIRNDPPTSIRIGN